MFILMITAFNQGALKLQIYCCYQEYDNTAGKSFPFLF